MIEDPMITSKQNEVYKHLVKLKKAKYRNEHQEAVIFGDDLVEEARKANKIIQMIGSSPHGDHLVLSKELMHTLMDYEMKSPIGARVSIQYEQKAYSGNILICDTIQDPRNLGALIRSAHAFGFHKIILSQECVNPYHELALRAAKGSTFHVNIEISNLVDAIQQLKNNGYTIIASSHKKQPNQKQIKSPVAIILGNEGHGISKELLEQSHISLHIETQGVDSLNVSVAGSILMYQLSERV